MAARLPPADRATRSGPSSYPADWPALSRAAKTAAGGRCQGSPQHPLCRAAHGAPHPLTGEPVALTMVHLNGSPSDFGSRNIRVWCQVCHAAWFPHREDPAFWPEADMPMSRFVHHLMAMVALDELSGFLDGFTWQRLRLSVAHAEALQNRMHDIMRATAPKARKPVRRKG